MIACLTQKIYRKSIWKIHRTIGSVSHSKTIPSLVCRLLETHILLELPIVFQFLITCTLLISPPSYFYAYPWIQAIDFYRRFPISASGPCFAFHFAGAALTNIRLLSRQGPVQKSLFTDPLAKYIALIFVFMQHSITELTFHCFSFFLIFSSFCCFDHMENFYWSIFTDIIGVQ